MGDGTIAAIRRLGHMADGEAWTEGDAMSQGYDGTGGYGQGGFGPPPGMAPPVSMGPYRSAAGSRVAFGGAGLGLFVIWLLYNIVPTIGLQVAQAGAKRGAQAMLADGGGGVFSERASNEMILVSVAIALAGFAVSLVIAVVYQSQYLKFYWNNLRLEGRQCRYEGTLGGLAAALVVPTILTVLSCGLYYPWAYRAYQAYAVSHVDVEGERLQFNGSAGALFPVMLLGGILSMCTFGIYLPWYMNDVYAWFWEGVTLNGRSFTFRKDGSDLLVTLLGVGLLSVVTLFVYIPWGYCKVIHWEAGHVE